MLVVGGPVDLAPSLTADETDRLLQAEALVRAYCGWHVAPSRTETVSVRGSGGSVLMLPTLRLTAVDTVTDDGTAVTADGYLLDRAGFLTRLDACWGTEAVTVSMTHGYDAAPAEVTGVVQAVAQRAVDNPGSRPRDQVGPFVDSYSQTGTNEAPALALLAAEKDILDRYRLPALP